MRTLFTTALALCAIGAGAAYAGEDAPALTQPMKFGDQAMSCAQLVEEAGAMEALLGGDPSQSLMDGEYLANTGTGLAQQAALSAGVGGRAVGAIGQVGGLLGKSSKKKKEQAAAERAVAEKRWLYVAGLYHGKGCDAQLAASSAQ